MQRPDPAASGVMRPRLQALAARWLAECEQLHLALMVRQGELEQCQRLAAMPAVAAQPADPFLLRLCDELAASCDHLADELAHVRLALLGLAEELAVAPTPALATVA